MSQKQERQADGARARRWRRYAVELVALLGLILAPIVAWRLWGRADRLSLRDGVSVSLDVARVIVGLFFGLGCLAALAWLHWSGLRAEAALARSEAYWRGLVRQLHNGVLILRPQPDGMDATVLDLNQAVAHMAGQPREALIGRPWLEIFPGETSPSRRELQAMWRNDHVSHVPAVRYRAESGADPIDLWLNLHLFTLPAGELVVVLEDITQRHTAEASARRLQTVVQQMSEAVILSDAQGRVMYVNQALCNLYGYVAADVLGQDVLALYARRNSEGQADLGLMRHHLVAGQPFEVEVEDHRLDGHAFVVRLAATRLQIEEQADPCWLSLLSDVTEQRELEQRLRQVAKMEAVGRLAGGIAHDFNNLLTVINGYTQMAITQVPEDDPLVADLRTVAEAGERATRLTRQLLAFSRRQILQLRAVDLNSVVEGLLPMLASILGESVDLVLDLAPDLPQVEADASQLEQVILNLVVNAGDAMPGGGRLTLRTADITMDRDFIRSHRGARPGHYAVLHVQDTGIGMTPEVQAHLFEPFFTTKGVGQGTGLGLATSYGIIKQSRGYIYAESAPAQGATFSVYLPFAETSAEETPPHAGPAGLPLGTETLLVVEDDSVVRCLTTEFLQRLGYTVLAANGADEALRLFGQHSRTVALVLTDIVMPTLSGPQLAARLRTLLPELTVLYMTGYSDAALQERGILQPGMDILRKPFDMATLAFRVRTALDSTPEPMGR